MLNGVSCWYIDWATIGTWVGGVGAAAAAWAAVWAVWRGERERENFAKYLFNKDLTRLEDIVGLIDTLPIFLNFYDHASESQRNEGMRMAAEIMTKVSTLANQYEYFGHSEQQFHYRPKCDEFSTLTRRAATAFHFERMTERLLFTMKSKEPAIEHTKEVGRIIKIAIDAWKMGKRSDE